MAKQIISASTDTTGGLGYFLTKLWAKIKVLFYTKTETDGKLSGKQATITGGATTITSSDLTVSRALVSDDKGKVAVSEVTSAELGYLDGVTSAIQTQLNGKASTSALTNGSVTKVGTTTKGSSTQPIYLSSGSPTTCSTYAGGTKVTLNGTSKGASTASFYAPTTAGAAGFLLQSNGSGAPAWTNSIRPAALEMLPGSTSAGHGGYIDFHYNNSEEDFTSRIIDTANSLQLVGKPLSIMGCTLFLGAGNNYKVAADDKVWLICSYGANTITLDNSGGWTNREIYLFSPINSDNSVAYYTRADGSTLVADTMNMLRNKMYHFIFYSGAGWICDNPNVETSRYDASSNYTLADFGIGRIYAGSSSAAITITLPDAQVYEGREVIVTNSSYSNKNVIVSYKQNQSGNDSITLTALNSARFVGAISSEGAKYWLAFN